MVRLGLSVKWEEISGGGERPLTKPKQERNFSQKKIKRIRTLSDTIHLRLDGLQWTLNISDLSNSPIVNSSPQYVSSLLFFAFSRNRKENHVASRMRIDCVCYIRSFLS